MSLQMKGQCQQCAAGLSPHGEAFICSYECTFCPSCHAELKAVCPNCGGELLARPRRRSMQDNVIFHNPRCSKSRATLALLHERGADVTVVEYLNAPPSAEELRMLCEKLKVSALDITRKKEKRFLELGLSAGDDRSEAEWFRILSENPVLIERPIVIVNGRAAMGRPPENVLSILS
jgi:arsenate reductase